MSEIWDDLHSVTAAATYVVTYVITHADVVRADDAA